MLENQFQRNLVTELVYSYRAVGLALGSVNPNVRNFQKNPNVSIYSVYLKNETFSPLYMNPNIQQYINQSLCSENSKNSVCSIRRLF